MNTLRCKVKDAITEMVKEYGRELYIFEDSPANIADAIFDALDISEEQQDIEGARVVVNPEVRVDINGGVATLQHYTKGVKIELRDYDVVEDDEELEHDENGDKYFSRS